MFFSRYSFKIIHTIICFRYPASHYWPCWLDIAFSLRFFSGWEDEFLFMLHIDGRPAFRPCFGEVLLGTSVVGNFPLGIGVVNQKRKSLALAYDGPLEHLQVAVGVAVDDRS